VSDRELASVIAEKLNEYLRSHATAIAGHVYALSLWSYGEYGELGLNIATERQYEPARRAPVHLAMSDEVLAAPASVRWNSGDWEFVAERFCTESTQQRLNVLRDVIDEAGFRYVDDPNEVNCAALARLERQWDLLANDVMAQARPLSLLECSPDAVAWVECANYTRPVEHAMSMTLTSDRDVLRRLFPHWRRLCDALDATDPDTLARLREFRDTQPIMRISELDEQARILTPKVEGLLADCGFTRWDLAGWDGARVPSDFDPDVPNAVTNQTIALAFVVAERIG
jgi:hypothetical protein